MSVKIINKKNDCPHSFYCLIDLLKEKKINKITECQQKIFSVDNSPNISFSTNPVANVVYQNIEKLEQYKENSLMDYPCLVSMKKRVSKASLLSKSDEINSNYLSQNNSKLETDVGSPKGSNIFNMNRKNSLNSNDQSKYILPNGSYHQYSSVKNSKNNSNLHSRETSTFNLDFLEPFSIKNSTKQIREENSKLKEEMKFQLDKMLQRSKSVYNNLKDQMSNRIKLNKQKNLTIIDKGQEPTCGYYNFSEQYNINEVLVKTDSVNSKLLSEGALLQGQQYFTKKLQKQNLAELIKKEMEPTHRSDEVQRMKKMEKQNQPIFIIRDNALKNSSFSCQTKQQWDISTKEIIETQKQQNKQQKDKILTDWYVPNKYKGKRKEEITIEKQHPYIKDPEYLYQNLYNIYDLYPTDPFQNEGMSIKSKKKQKQLTQLINYRERLAHSPIIQDLAQKMKESNIRIPLIIKDAYIKSEKRGKIHEI